MKILEYWITTFLFYSVVRHSQQGSHPRMKRSPVVTVDVKNNRIRFICTIFPYARNSAFHEVIWFQGEERVNIPTQMLTNGETKAYLQNNNTFGEKPFFCLGQKIYCKVKSYYKRFEKSASPYQESNRFFAGFQVEPKVLDITDKSKTHKATFTNTVPIVCKDIREGCNTAIEIFQETDIGVVTNCTVRFSPSPFSQEKVIEVVAKYDPLDYKGKESFVNFVVPSYIDPLDWNCHKDIPDLKVIRGEKKKARCVASRKIVTFDGLLYYDQYRSPNDYVLVDSKVNDFKVETRTRRYGKKTRPCAIVAQEGDDVVSIDICDQLFRRVRFLSLTVPHPFTRVTRSGRGNRFKIEFPSGATINVRVILPHYLAIDIEIPSDYYKSTTGLCGTFDDTIINHWTVREGMFYLIKSSPQAPAPFVKSWRKSFGKSLFFYRDNEKRDTNLNHQAPEKYLGSVPKVYCQCERVNVTKLNTSGQQINCHQGRTYKNRTWQKGWKELVSPLSHGI